MTIARAIELKHNATLIAALAYETANFYQKAGERFCLCKSGLLLKASLNPFAFYDTLLKAPVFCFSDHTLNTLEPECSSKWRKYLQLKQYFYMAYVSFKNVPSLLTSVYAQELPLCRHLSFSFRIIFQVYAAFSSSMFMAVLIHCVCRHSAIMDRHCWQVTSVVNL